MTSKPFQHLNKQIMSGEFGAYEREASFLNAHTFHKEYGGTEPFLCPLQCCIIVVLDGTSYGWHPISGKYLGWARMFIQ